MFSEEAQIDGFERRSTSTTIDFDDDRRRST
jgi:hypothetical protein